MSRTYSINGDVRTVVCVRNFNQSISMNRNETSTPACKLHFHHCIGTRTHSIRGIRARAWGKITGVCDVFQCCFCLELSSGCKPGGLVRVRRVYAGSVFSPLSSSLFPLSACSRWDDSEKLHVLGPVHVDGPTGGPNSQQRRCGAHTGPCVYTCRAGEGELTYVGCRVEISIELGENRRKYWLYAVFTVHTAYTVNTV